MLEIVIALTVVTILFVLGRRWCGPRTLSGQWQRFPLQHKQQISRNTAVYRFKLPRSDQKLGLPVGQHVSVKARIGDKDYQRNYTPISEEHTTGYFELLVKTYEHGKVSSYFSRLKVGDEIDVAGPRGQFRYEKNMVDALGMVAGGTGITPMLQIIRCSLHDRGDRTRIHLVYANWTEEDILMKSELDRLAQTHERLSIYYVLNDPPGGWTGGTGFVTRDLLEKRLPQPSPRLKVLICGPPPMVKAVTAQCEELGYGRAKPVSKAEDSVFKF